MIEHAKARNQHASLSKAYVRIWLTVKDAKWRMQFEMLLDLLLFFRNKSLMCMKDLARNNIIKLTL